jgi:hypothetical protein
MAPDGRLKGGVIFVRRFAPGCAGIIAENALELFDLALLHLANGIADDFVLVLVPA